MNICTYAYTCIYIYIYIYMYMYIYIHICTYIYILCMCVCVSVYIYIYTYIQIDIHVHVYLYIYRHIYVYLYRYMHIYTLHTYIYMNTAHVRQHWLMVYVRTQCRSPFAYFVYMYCLSLYVKHHSYAADCSVFDEWTRYLLTFFVGLFDMYVLWYLTGATRKYIYFDFSYRSL